MKWRCVDCPLECPYVEADEHFYRRRSGTFESRCKGCTAERAAKWKAANRERRRAYDRARYASSPELRAYINDHSRERKRRIAGTTPDRYRSCSEAPSGLVEATQLQEAVRASGRPFRDIAAAAGLSESTVRKAFERQTLRATTAIAILRALDIAPAEVGL